MNTNIFMFTPVRKTCRHHVTGVRPVRALITRWTTAINVITTDRNDRKHKHTHTQFMDHFTLILVLFIFTLLLSSSSLQQSCCSHTNSHKYSYAHSHINILTHRQNMVFMRGISSDRQTDRQTWGWHLLQILEGLLISRENGPERDWCSMRRKS